MPTCSNIFLDKISLTLDYESEEEQKGITTWIHGMKESNDISLHGLYANYRGMGYKNNWKLILDDPGNVFCLVQTDPYKPNASFLRFEWNPSKAGINGNRRLWDNLTYIIHIDDYPRLFSEAIVTRVDIATDVQPVTPDLLWVDGKRLRKTKLISGNRGDLETLYLGTRSSKLHFAIYNRDEYEERICQPGDPATTRIEARIHADCTLSNIRQIDNPFRRLTVLNAKNDEHNGNIPHRYQHFIDSCRFRGYQSALRLIRDTRTRRKYRDWMETHFSTDWWNPEELWNGLPAAINVLALPPRRKRRPRII